MIPTLRRGRDDVFLIGEEQLLATQDAGADRDPTDVTLELDGRPTRRAGSPRLPGSLQGVRGLALLGLAAAATALLVTLEPSGDGKGPTDTPATSSPRSPLISRSAARVPAEPTARVHPPAARPAEVHRPTVVHRRSPRPHGPVPSPTPVIQSEPEREPTRSVAPVSSPAVTATVSTPAPEVASAATAEPAPPGPPPPSSGGGPAGVESFGFER